MKITAGPEVFHGETTKVRRNELSPHGVPAIVIIVIQNLAFFLSGLMMHNLIPASEFLRDAGVLSGSGMDPEQIKETLIYCLNVGTSMSLFLTPVLQAIAQVGGGLKLLAIIMIFGHFGGMFIMYYAASKAILMTGVMCQCLGFPATMMLLPTAFGMYPNHGSTLNSFNMFSGDFSVILCGLIRLVGGQLGLSMSTTFTSYLLFVFLPVGCFVIFLAPRWGETNWVKYITAKRCNDGVITYKEYIESINLNQEDKVEGKVEGFNPSIDPPYHGLTLKKAATTTHMLFFLGMFIPHFLRLKKLLMPYLDKIFMQKGLSAGVPVEEIESILTVFYTLPAFGWVPGLLYGVFADFTGNGLAILAMNIVVSSGYFLFAFFPWSSSLMYFVALCYTLNNGLCLGMGIAYLNEYFGPRLIGSLIASYLVLSGLVGIVSDLVIPGFIDRHYGQTGNYMGIMNMVLALSMISLCFSFIMVLKKAPKPTGAPVTSIEDIENRLTN